MGSCGKCLLHLTTQYWGIVGTKRFRKAGKLKTNFQKKLLKTVVYRLTASGLAQLLSWLFFRRIEVNVVVLAVDSIQMAYYFFFESFWNLNSSQVNAIRKRISFTADSMNTCRILLKRKGYSDNVIRKIWKWYGLS